MEEDREEHVTITIGEKEVSAPEKAEIAPATAADTSAENKNEFLNVRFCQRIAEMNDKKLVET